MDFAHKAKIHYVTIGYYINKIRVPEDKVAMRIVEASNGEITLEDLRGKNGEKHRNPSGRWEIS